MKREGKIERNSLLDIEAHLDMIKIFKSRM